MDQRLLKLKRGLEELDITLPEEVLVMELAFLDELSRWASKVNLTAVRGAEEGVERHLIDSLVLLKELGPGPLLDIGSGAGLPSLPLALARPELHIESVESVGKKVNFQRHIRRAYNLRNFTVHQSRVEELKPQVLFSQITARAFAPVGKIITLVDGLLAPGGELLLLRGSVDESRDADTLAALDKFSMQIRARRTYRLPFSGASRHLLKITRNA